MKAKILPFVVIAALLAAGGAWWWQRDRAQPTSDALIRNSADGANPLNSL